MTPGQAAWAAREALPAFGLVRAPGVPSCRVQIQVVSPDLDSQSHLASLFPFPRAVVGREQGGPQRAHAPSTIYLMPFALIACCRSIKKKLPAIFIKSRALFAL